MKYLFVFSSQAGNKSFQTMEDSLVSFFRGKNLDFEIVYTLHKDHARDLVKRYKDREDLIFYLCSGDGTLSEVADQMILSKAPFTLGYIPGGTANDFSKNFDFSTIDLRKTLDPSIYPIDLIKVNDRHCINVFSFGFDTLILNSAYKIMAKYPSLGHRAYPLALLKNIGKIPSYELDIELVDFNGKVDRLRGHFILGAICNGGYYGGGFNPSPRAQISDGAIEICLAGTMPLLRLAPLILKYKRGRHLPHKDIYFKKILRGRIQAKDDLMANIDGEIFTSKEIDFQILPQAISFADISK